mmetsp:Transcript_56266/g.98732  ORF Transcript_56266/g.98732 Transcript_56266/m.98732 type:complete len:269 (-) Transcript_56266:894-1700(-)
MRPAYGRKGPQSRTEPGVQDILVLREHHAGAVLLLRYPPRLLRTASHNIRHFGTSGASGKGDIVHRDTVSPPELPADAPVVDVLQPVVPHLLEPFRWQDGDLSTAHRLHRALRHVLRGDEPLFRDHGLDHLAASLAAGNSLHMCFGAGAADALQAGIAWIGQTSLHEIAPQVYAALLPTQSSVLASEFVNGGILVHDADQGQIVFLAEGVVVHIVRGGDLQGTSAKLAVYVLIGNHWDQAVAEWDADHLSNVVLVPHIVRMHAHRTVS